MAYAPDLGEMDDYGAGPLIEARLLAVQVESKAGRASIVDWSR
jgi:hypothetical protein